MGDRPYNVLFLCTGNSARSILAESLLNHHGRGKFRAYSAGSFPKGEVNPLALELLRRLDLPADGLRSKSWDEFAQPGAPELDFIITVCDNAAGEVCPIWPGHPVTAHWGLPDPAAVEGAQAEKLLAFRETCPSAREPDQTLCRVADCVARPPQGAGARARNRPYAACRWQVSH